MADAVSSSVLINGPSKYVVRLTNISDGTGESNVVKVDISTLRLADGTPPSQISIKEIQWSIQGFSSVRLLWDQTADELIDVLSGNGYRDYSPFGVLSGANTGGTGDILLTTAGAVNGATYDITLVCIIS